MPEILRDGVTCVTCGEPGSKRCSKCLSVTYCSSQCQRQDWTRHKRLCVPVVITQVPGKGRGLVASRDIDAGELILKDKIVVTHPRNAILLSEEDRSAVVVQDHGNNEDVFNLPRISYPRNSLLQQVEKLSKSEQEEFWQLSCKDDKYGHVYEKGSKLRALGIMMTNGMFFNDTRNNVDLCLSIALINNSCLPNCVDHPALEDQNIREVRAVENIKKGEEITISYETNSMYEKKAVRQKKIKKHWDFDCICSRCAEGDVQEEMDLKVSMDKLMAMMAAASSSIPDMMMTKTWEKLATWEDKQIDLLRRVSFASIQMPHELASMVKFAQLARKGDLIEKGMKLLKNTLEKRNVDIYWKNYARLERMLSNWDVKKSKALSLLELRDFGNFALSFTGGLIPEI